jgi:hypothetical protein
MKKEDHRVRSRRGEALLPEFKTGRQKGTHLRRRQRQRDTTRCSVANKSARIGSSQEVFPERTIVCWFSFETEHG